MAKVDDPSQAFHSGQAKARSALDETSNGEFKRTDSTYRDHIQQGTRFEPEGMLISSTLLIDFRVSTQCRQPFYFAVSPCSAV